MDLKQLSYFTTVVKEGTISGAARKLNLSQPPLSTQMKLLEEEFGCVLFQRGSRKIQLTEAGQLLYERAVTMLELSEVTRKELLDYRNGLTGALRLGVVSSVGCSLLPEWVAAFHKDFPAIRFELFEANTYQLLEQLRSNLIELAIIRTPFHGEGFSCTTLCEEPMLAVGSGMYFSDILSGKDPSSP
ncbi:MAG: LysR family transcriptional regulator, partial [Eisenbergiella sp.]